MWSSSDNVLKQQYGKFYSVYIDINDTLQHYIQNGEVFTTYNYDDLIYDNSGEGCMVNIIALPQSSSSSSRLSSYVFRFLSFRPLYFVPLFSPPRFRPK